MSTERRDRERATSARPAGGWRFLGCKVSRVEAAAAARDLEAAGASAWLLHGCAVTDRAERDGRRAIRRLAREHPGVPLVVSGCLAERSGEALARLPEVALVVGTGVTTPLADLLAARDSGLLPDKIVRRGSGVTSLLGADPGRVAVSVDETGTRAFLKVQDGCARRCAYCIVPALRGAERSAAVADVEEAVRRLAGDGVPEVVLTGVHLAAFGTDRGESLLVLLERLERKPPGCRVRLSSLEPMEAGGALVDAVATSRVVVPHLHLPLQSGSDAVLRRMRRGLVAGRFVRLVERARRANPRLHLATDLIAGFPLETDAEHAETLALVDALPFASLHVFPFSVRSGTRAAELNALSPLPAAVVTRRAAELRALGAAKERAFRRAANGDRADAVALRDGRVLTDHYLEARWDSDTVGPPPGWRGIVGLAAAGPAAELSARPL